MKIARFILLFGLTAFVAASAADKPSALDLAGKWEGHVTFGKFKFTLVLRVSTNEPGRIKATLDLPEQGQTGVPVDALLFNAPDFRLEIDGFGTAYIGKVNADLTEIVGGFEEGPGGRPEPLTFKRSTQSDAPEPTKTFTLAPGEKPDLRGYWRGEIEVGPNMKFVTGLNIGRLADGSFRATMDLPEQGAKDIPSTIVTNTADSATFLWQGFQTNFVAKMSEDGKKLSGNWIQRGRTNVLSFTRIDAPVQLLPANLSFDPETGKVDDVRGYWKGLLETPGGKLRLVVRIGRTPDGQFAGTLASLDQGGKEIPASTAEYLDSKLKMEWKGIRGKYEGTLSSDGKLLEGKWEQFGAPMPLKLERTTAAEAKSKS